MSYTTAIVRMWAVVGGEIVDLVDFQCSYAVNQVPKAVAKLPVGREVHTLMPASSHLIATQTQIQIPTNVYIQVGYGSGATTTILPVGTYLLFAGWTTGIGYRHSYNGLSMTLEMTHWLVALTFASSLCQGSHPENPAQFTFNQRIAMQPGAQGHIFPVTLGGLFFDGDKITEDLWGQSLKPWLEFLVGSRRLDQGAIGGVDNDTINSDAAAALNLFQGTTLPFDPGPDVPADIVAMAIGDDVVFSTLQANDSDGAIAALARTTLWGKLVTELRAKLYFTIIPFPHKAMVVPFVAGLRNFWDPWGCGYTFLARDLDMYDVTANLIRPIRAMGFSVGHGGQHGDVQGENEWTPGDIGGWYIARNDGMVKIQQAPRWLSEFAPLSAYTDLTTGIGGNTRSSALTPTEGVPPTVEATKTIKKQQRTILDKFAHANYVAEMLRHRTARISGPLRFDVCPGSTVRIEGTAGAFLAGVDPHGEPRRASVLRVSYWISAQGAQAGAIYDLAHVRTETENLNADTSIARHPFYDKVWVGDYSLATA